MLGPVDWRWSAETRRVSRWVQIVLAHAHVCDPFSCLLR